MQKELNWICFVSFHIWIPILHYPRVTLTQFWTTRHSLLIGCCCFFFFMTIHKIWTKGILLLVCHFKQKQYSRTPLFRRKIEFPWIYPSPLCFPGYFENLLFRTFFHFPWDFEIAGFDCIVLHSFIDFTFFPKHSSNDHMNFGQRQEVITEWGCQLRLPSSTNL